MFYNLAIAVKGITKKYKLYDKPADRLKEIVFRRPYHRELAALDGITFSVEQGETLGLIGENGAGKSTLLKILAKTLSPSQGEFEIHGRVSSLLELGTGFHPEFTGLENIYFYGSLLGIDNRDMAKKIDEIVAFSELGDFIGYPIKTYSTGMFVRLAFSVATMVNPDILIVDEALSVGDQYFQKKCLDKMTDFKKKRKTIIFCSHDTYQIKMFCEKTIWLHHGKLHMLGRTADVVQAYSSHEQMKAGAQKTENDLSSFDDRQNSFIFINHLSVKQQSEKQLHMEFGVASREPFHGHIGWAILRKDLLQVSFMTTAMQNKEPFLFDSEERLVTIRIKDLALVNGTYVVYVGVFDKEALRPLLIESQEIALKTNIDILNSVCFLNSDIDVAA